MNNLKASARPDPGSGTPVPPRHRVAAIAKVRREVARVADRGDVLLPGDSLIVAVSGGADSTTLLDALARLAPPRRWVLTCVHVDHGLRADSAKDADTVASLAEQRGVAFESVRADLPPRGSLQDRARRGRYAALDEVADRVGAAAILTGHTADDQAETVLWRVLCGAPPASLAGMAVRNGRVVRPLLGVWRAQTVAYCRALGVEPLQDPANMDARHLRTRLRHEVIPALEAVTPAVRRRLVVLAQRQRDALDLNSSSAASLAASWAAGHEETPC